MALIRSLTDLAVYPDDTGAPWWSIREVAQLLRQPDTRHVSRTFERGILRRTTPAAIDWRFRQAFYLMDARALVEACLSLSQIPGSTVRAYVQGRSGQKQCVAQA